VNKINHLWAHMHGISFYFSLVWVKKTIYKFASGQHHFSSSIMWIK
jgi:hypothetical protein